MDKTRTPAKGKDMVGVNSESLVQIPLGNIIIAHIGIDLGKHGHRLGILRIEVERIKAVVEGALEAALPILGASQRGKSSRILFVEFYRLSRRLEGRFDILLNHMQAGHRNPGFGVTGFEPGDRLVRGQGSGIIAARKSVLGIGHVGDHADGGSGRRHGDAGGQPVGPRLIEDDRNGDEQEQGPEAAKKARAAAAWLVLTV